MRRFRILSAVSAAAVLFGSAGLMPAELTASAEPEELFADGFEDGKACGWASHGGAATVSLSTEQAHSGSASMFITNREQDWQGAECSKVGYFYAGETYTCSIWFYYDDEDGAAQQNFQLGYKYVQNGQTQYSSVGSCNAKKGTWTEMKSEVTFPAGVTGITLYTQCSDTDLPYYIDDCIGIGEKHANSGQKGFSYDFDDGDVADWYGRSCDVKVSTKMAHSGDYSLHTSNRSDLWMSPAVDCTLYVEPGGYYSFECWAAYDGSQWTDTAAFQMYLMYNQNGTTEYKNLADETTARGEWVKIATRFTIPEDATNIAFYVQPKWSSNPSQQDLTMDFYIDDVVCKEMADPVLDKTVPSLCKKYEDLFKVGCAATASELVPQATKDMIELHYNSLTFGNELKPESVLVQDACIATGSETGIGISLETAKPLLEYAKKTGIPVRGHTLVWHSQTPEWFFHEGYDKSKPWASREVMLGRMENYIKAVFEKIKKDYPDVNFYCWDVVNEAILDDGSFRPAGSTEDDEGNSPWIKTIGSDYITYAFQYARAYAPAGIKLFYNDFNEYTPAKRDAIIKVVKGLKEKQLIDGVGMQSHLQMGSPSAEGYETALRMYGDLGLEVQITELDVNCSDNSRSGQLELAERYRSLMETILKCKKDGVNITAVVIWGITDATSWIGGYPILFDEDYQAKPSFYAMLDPEKPIQTVKNKDALPFVVAPGSSSDASARQVALDAQAATEIGSAGSFKAIYNTHDVYIYVTAKKDAKLTIFFDGQSVDTKQMKAGETYISEQLITRDNKQYNFDIQLGSENWNSIDEKLSIDAAGTLTLAEMPTLGEAFAGTITVDGKIDEAWDKASSLRIDNFQMGNADKNAQGTAKVMWDAKNLYVLIQVNDPNGLHSSSSNHYECDTVEVFFDENNAKTAAYQGDDIQCRVGYDNSKSVSDNRTLSDFVSATAETSNGYLIEIAIPATLGTFRTGQTVGFDIQINDDNNTGERVGAVNWSGDKSGMGYTDTRCFGVLTLTGDQPGLPGDANCDGFVDVSDAVLLCKFITGDSTAKINDTGLKNGNVDGKNGITDEDVSRILKYIVHLIQVL